MVSAALIAEVRRAIWADSSSEYFDVYCTLYLPDGREYRRQVFLELDTGAVGLADWEYAADEDITFDHIDARCHTVPPEVVKALRAALPEIADRLDVNVLRLYAKLRDESKV